MKSRIGALVVFLSAFAASAGQPKIILAHFMPWFVGKPYTDYWGYHWTMNHFNPDTINTNGQRDIASWYYPLIGPYDSLDPVVLEYQVVLMKLAGIDGVIVDWYGQDNYYDYSINNIRTLAIQNYCRMAGLTFALCYEDATIGAEISGGTMNGITVTPATAVAHAQQTMLYAQSNYFTDPSYSRLSGGPVLLNFGPQYFKTNSQWQAIFSVLDPTNQPAFFTEDNRLPVGLGAFDWPPMYLSQPTGGSNVLSDAAMQNYLTAFDQKAAAWPAYVSSAFPRFHDIYAQAGGTSLGYLDDNNSITFQETLTRATTNSSAIIQLVTWNDYAEGTIIEPTVQYGYRDLGIIQDYRRQYLDAGFSYHTNDLTAAARLYALRRQYPSNSIILAELDRAFTDIVSGHLAVATQRLTGIESTRPLLYNLSGASGQLQFFIGGYLSSSGVEVQMSSDPGFGSWLTVSNFPAATYPPLFSIGISVQATATFFRARNTGP